MRPIAQDKRPSFLNRQMAGGIKGDLETGRDVGCEAQWNRGTFLNAI